MINIKKLSKAGIVGFGVYLPDYAISVDKIADVWGMDGESIKNSLGVFQKTVSGFDEDSITMAVEAGRKAIKMAGISPSKIGAVFVGSESHPYAVKPSGTVVGEALGLGNDYFCADLQFACKAGTTGLQIVASMIEAGLVDYGLVIGSDKAQARPGDVLEYTACSAAVCFLLGRQKGAIADFKFTYSFSSDTPDFWRRQNCEFPEHMGRFTGKPAYFKHIEKAAKNLLLMTDYKIKDFGHVVFHMPNGKFPKKMAKKLKVSDKQLETGLIVSHIGNPYSASSLIGLAKVLEQAEANQKILLVSYGSGSGGDSFIFAVKRSLKFKKPEQDFDNQVKNLKQIDYVSYLRCMGII